MTKILVGLGDEHSFLTHSSIAKNNDFKHCDLTYTNAGIQTIYRMFVKFFAEIYNNNNEYIFLIGIPHPNKIELRHNSQNPINFKDFNYYNYSESIKTFPTNSYKMLKNYHNEIFEKVLIEDKLKVHLFVIENILQNKKIKYLLYNLDTVLNNNIPTNNNFFQPFNPKYVRHNFFKDNKYLLHESHGHNVFGKLLGKHI